MSGIYESDGEQLYGDGREVDATPAPQGEVAEPTHDEFVPQGPFTVDNVTDALLASAHEDFDLKKCGINEYILVDELNDLLNGRESALRADLEKLAQKWRKEVRASRKLCLTCRCQEMCADELMALLAETK